MNNIIEKVLAILAATIFVLAVSFGVVHVICMVEFGDLPISDVPAWAAYFMFG